MTKVRAKAKPLTPDQWAEMCTRYQLGDGIREIARDFNYDSGNLTRRFQKEGIIQHSLQHAVTEKVTATVKELQNYIPETADGTAITTTAQRKLIQRAVNARLASWLTIAEDTTDIAFNFNQELLNRTVEMAKPGVKDGYKPHEATQVLRSIVSTHGMLLEQTGISAKPVDPPDPNANSALSQIDNAVDASRAYQELINGTK